MPGLLVVISSPSGGGKDAVINALLKIFSSSARLVTTTSRPPRPGNREGIDYFFISRGEFERKIDNNEFAEYNLYSNNYYGTNKRYLENLLSRYEVVLTQIEVNGKHNLDKSGVKHLSFFLLPENLEVLRQRIKKRGGLTPNQIADRLKTAETEIAASADYDHRLVNVQGKLKETVATVAQLIRQRQAIDKKRQSG